MLFDPLPKKIRIQSRINSIQQSFAGPISCRDMATKFRRNYFKPLSPVRAGLLSLLLLLSCVGFLLFFYQQLFGASGGVSLAFSVSVLVTIGAHALNVVTRAEPCGPEGLAGSLTRIRHLKRPLIVVLAIVAIVWVISAPTFLVSTRFGWDGGAEHGPLFAPREAYRLANHGAFTEVSALRFWIVAVSGLFFMLSTFMSFALFALYAILFGDPSDLWKEPDSTNDRGESVEPSEPDVDADRRDARAGEGSS